MDLRAGNRIDLIAIESATLTKIRSMTDGRRSELWEINVGPGFSNEVRSRPMSPAVSSREIAEALWCETTGSQALEWQLKSPPM